jgi:hypothetical protein
MVKYIAIGFGLGVMSTATVAYLLRGDKGWLIVGEVSLVATLMGCFIVILFHFGVI